MVAGLLYRLSAGRVTGPLEKFYIDQHFLYFTPVTLERALALAGFETAHLERELTDLRRLTLSPPMRLAIRSLFRVARWTRLENRLFAVARPAEAMAPDTFYRNSEADEMLFEHEGSGVFDSIFGALPYGPGDYLVIPIGTTWRLDPDQDSPQRILWLESFSNLEPPRRYRNEYGQLLEHAPYCESDIRPPAEMGPAVESGDFVIEVKTRGRITAYHYRHHPFDLVGWDGHLWPFAFNIGDFEPITGRVHQPPPVHLTFQPRNFVVCSFVPRKFDYHPLAIPAPYNHSNINSDEVIYYVAGNFMSRRGVEIASFTLHPAGIPHGPHPGTVEASIGKEATEELAVMVDTFHPLRITQAAMDLDDGNYPYSWLPSDDHAREASELAERGPEAFPD